MNPRRRSIMLLTVVLSVCMVGFYLLRYVEPTETSLFPKCMLHQWTGLHCPGCGATRAAHALLRGRWLDALRFNPLLIIGLPIIMVGVWYQRQHGREGMAMSAKFAAGVTIVMLVYFVARNVPSPQRSWLAPPSLESVSHDRDATR